MMLSSRALGSSPLARGLPIIARLDSDVYRIIPARAGFTAPQLIAAWRETDHPRSRGVYYLENVASVPVIGSSPLARGLQKINKRFGLDVGIIPARAGFTHRRY